MEAAARTHSNKPNETGRPGYGAPFFKPVVQAKLSINEPGDRYEQEADSMAETVMRMTDTSLNQGAFFKPLVNTVQRKHQHDEEDKKIQGKEAATETVAYSPPNQDTFFKPVINHVQRKCHACEEEEQHLHRKESARDQAHSGNELDNYVGSLKSSGQPMQETSRKFFEPRFGHDFSNVRLHTDSVAAKSAQSINALAYTTGNNIVFNNGQYTPETPSGQRLLAHELTHVVQQGAAAEAKTIQRDINNGVNQLPGGGAQQTGTDPQCEGFSPIAKVTKKDKGTTTVLGLMSDVFDVFNAGAGKVTTVGCVANASNTVGEITFLAAPGAAWQTTAKLQDCTDPAPTAKSPPLPWRVVFIQTVESATYGAKYGNNKFTSVKSAGRDALNSNVAAPWYDAPNGPFGSQLYPTVPQINDTPHTAFPIVHPNDAKAFLQSVCMQGKFNIWLIVHHKDVPPTTANVDFLYHWSVNMNLHFLLNNPDGSLHPCNITAWLNTGMLTMSKGPGQGSGALTWATPIANDAKVTDNALTSDPCIKKP